MANDPASSPLFREQGTASAPGHPALIGGHCRACGGVFFPIQHHGCESCGSTDIEERALSGRGRLVNLAQVHLHARPDRKAPFTVGSVVTDDGVVVRALLDSAVADTLQAGDTVVTLLVQETRADRGVHDLRFGKEI